jgi:hypothetical protein
VSGRERRWTRVSKSHPCAACHKSDYCCHSGSIILCMRVKSPKPSNCKLGGWLHFDDSLALPFEAPPQVVQRPEINWATLAKLMYLDPRAATARAFLAKSLNVTEASLLALRVGYGYDDYRQVPYTSWPERDELGNVIGIIRRYEDGSKLTMRYSSHGLYYAMNWLKMPSAPIFIPEGGSDTAALLTMGVNAVGRPSNLGGVGLLAKFLASEKNQVVILAERDQRQVDQCQCGKCLLCWPGLAGAIESAARLESLLGRTVHWALPPEKDVRAWLQHHPGMTGPRFLTEVTKWK